MPASGEGVHTGQASGITYLLIVAVLVLPVLQEPRPLALLLAHSRTARLSFVWEGGRTARQAGVVWWSFQR